MPAEVAGVVVGDLDVSERREVELLSGQELRHMEDLEGDLHMLRILLLEHPVAPGTGEDEGLDSQGLDGVDVPLVDLHKVLLGPADPAHDGSAADLVQGGEVHSQLLEDRKGRFRGLDGPVGRSTSGEICDGGRMGLVSPVLHHLGDRLLLRERVVVLDDALAHRLVLGQDVAVGHEVGPAELDDVDDVHLGRASPDTIRTGGTGIHRLHDGIVGLELSHGKTVGHDDTSPGEVGIPVDRFERGAYALAETAHRAGGEGRPDLVYLIGGEYGIAHCFHSSLGRGMVTLPSARTITLASGLASNASFRASATDFLGVMLALFMMASSRSVTAQMLAHVAISAILAALWYPSL